MCQRLFISSYSKVHSALLVGNFCIQVGIAVTGAAPLLQSQRHAAGKGTGEAEQELGVVWQ